MAWSSGEGVVARAATLLFGARFEGDVLVWSPSWVSAWRADAGSPAMPCELPSGLSAAVNEALPGLRASDMPVWLGPDAIMFRDAAARVLVLSGRLRDRLPGDAPPRWTPLPLEAGEAERARVVMDVFDLSERLAAAEAYRTIDAETGVLNRAAFLDHVEQALARHRRDGRPFTVARLDVSGLARLAECGDADMTAATMREMGRLLTEAVRREDHVARLGPDQFAMLFLGGDGQEAPAAIDRLLRTLSKFDVARRHGLAFFAGAATWMGDALTGMDLLNDAETMLAVDKVRRGGKGSAQTGRSHRA